MSLQPSSTLPQSPESTAVVKTPSNGSSKQFSRLGRLLTQPLQHLWVRLLYLVLMLAAWMADLALGWLIYRDSVLQLPGLVFGVVETGLLTAMLTFNLVALIAFGLEAMALTNLYWAEEDTWLMLDLVACLTLWLAWLPNCLTHTYLAACRESAVSIGLLAKAVVFLFLLFIRCLAHLMYYLSSLEQEDGYLQVAASSIPSLGRPAKASSDSEQTCTETDPLTEKPKRRQVIVCCDVRRVTGLRRFWCTIRGFFFFGLIVMFFCNLLIFKFTFVQTYQGHLEWRKIPYGQPSNLLNNMAERYFADVDIFVRYNLLKFPGSEEASEDDAWIRIIGLHDLFKSQENGEKLTFELVSLNLTRQTLIFFTSSNQEDSNSTSRVTCWELV
ncbi:unnamed protein product, partial [Protopolystoma xenopodis]